MVTDDKRVRIITGHYGSGKTEFAVNYVTALRESVEGKVAIADLDIVNVYFRSREKKKELEEKGITVIASNLEGAGVDVPAVSGAMTTPVTDKSFQYVVDLGGNDVGTLVLGRIKPLLDPAETDFLMVVNTYRPNITRRNRTDGKSGSCGGAEGDWLHQQYQSGSGDHGVLPVRRRCDIERSNKTHRYSGKVCVLRRGTSDGGYTGRACWRVVSHEV